MGGPDCGPVNPLQSLLKSQEQDGSVQRDRFQQIPTAGTSNGASMRTQNPNAMGGAFNQADLDREMQQFTFGMPGQMHAGPSGPAGADAFAMEAMHRELAQSARSNGNPAPVAHGDSGERPLACANCSGAFLLMQRPRVTTKLANSMGEGVPSSSHVIATCNAATE